MCDILWAPDYSDYTCTCNMTRHVSLPSAVNTIILSTEPLPAELAPNTVILYGVSSATKKRKKKNNNYNTIHMYNAHRVMTCIHVDGERVYSMCTVRQ